LLALFQFRCTFRLLCTDIPFNKRMIVERSKRKKHALITRGLFAGRKIRLLNVAATGVFQKVSMRFATY
jgi:hypothetical protein